jgi:hypothetical protein
VTFKIPDAGLMLGITGSGFWLLPASLLPCFCFGFASALLALALMRGVPGIGMAFLCST